jgi:SAM-dependent methyltransferase
MDPSEYAKLDEIEREHWFYRGKRDIVRHWLGRYLKLQPDDLLIDAGMGTGAFLEEMSSRCRVLGIDDHDESLALARPRIEAVGGGVLKSTLDQVPLPDGTAAVVTALDVLEHLDDDRAALRELIRLTRPGGLIILTVPALRWLWSDWDEAVHHRRRYHRPELLELCAEPGVELLRCAYINFATIVPIALIRGWRKLRPPCPDAPRAEDMIPPGPVNFALYQTFVRTAYAGWLKPPLGVSLLAVLRRAETV